MRTLCGRREREPSGLTPILDGQSERARRRTLTPANIALAVAYHGRQNTQPAAEAAAPSANPTTRWLEEARGRTDVILVDPPRCGLDADTLRLVSYFDHVLYISCNPEALLDNLQRGGLLQTHAMVRSAIFDHFAYTPHLECAVLLRRRTHCVNRPLWSTDSSNNKKWPSLMCTPRQRGKARYDKRYTVYDNHTL